MQILFILISVIAFTVMAIFFKYKKEMSAQKPYPIYITNSSDAPQKVVLFNSNINRVAANYGNNEFVSVQYAIAGYTYQQLLAQLEYSPINIGKLVFSNCRLPIFVRMEHSECDGRSYGYPFGKMLSDTPLKISDYIDGGAELSFVLAEKDRVLLEIYPTQKFSKWLKSSSYYQLFNPVNYWNVFVTKILLAKPSTDK